MTRAFDAGRQLPLDLGLPPSFAREDFIESRCNREALAAIDAWPEWSTHALMLLGPTGSGKTHLAHIFAAHTNARFIDPTEALPEIGDVYFSGRALVLEVPDGWKPDQTGLFHLLNQVRELGMSLLLTARSWPQDWGLTLADLRSRVLAIPAIELFEPDDALLNAVLVKLFADRQLIPDPTVVSYILRRIERSVAATIDIVDTLDREALAAKRAVTRSMAARILDSGSDG